MKKVHALLFLVVLSLLPAHVFAQPDKDKVVKQNGKKYYLHIVIKGETVYGISRDFNLGVKDIVLENPKAMDGISPGDTLHIPLMVAATANSSNNTTQLQKADSAKYIYHKVEPKETLYSLAKQYGVSVSVLDSLNPDIKDKGLRAGMDLRIPNHNYIAAAPNKADTTKGAQAFKNLVNGSNLTPEKKAGQLLNRYNIVLMLSFSQQEVDSVKMNKLLDGVQQFPLYAQISAGFYSGFKMGLDSLAMQGFNTNLHVFNIPMDSNGSRIDSVLKSPALASANLIIGPPYPTVFNHIAKYAKVHQIPIVSPLSAEINVLKDNPFASKAVPSAITETEQTADFIAAHNHGDNIIIVHNAEAANDNYFDLFKKRLNTALSIIEPKADSAVIVKYSDELTEVGKHISDKKYNVIVVPYQGNSFVPKMVNQFTNSKYNQDDSICIFGMHNWASMDVLDPNNLDTMHLHYPSNEYIDYTNHAVLSFIQKYRSNYSTEPGYYSYQGFDIAYFYGSMLKKYGTALQDNLPGEKYSGLHTSFDFYKPDEKGGLENKAIYMLEYKNYSLVKDNL